MTSFKADIFIDFDKTISPIHGFSDPPSPEIKECIDKLREKFNIVIFSCRANPDICNKADLAAMIDYLNRYEIYFDSIYTRKPLYFAIIDDRAYNPDDGWEKITEKLLSA